MKAEFISHSLEETQNLAKKIAEVLFKGAVITLDGDLGAGKTTFTQGVGLALGIKEKINSPTFNILKCYFSGKLPLYHIDAYRLEDQVNAVIGLEEVIEGDGICLIEWAKFIPNLINNALNVTIERVDDTSRRFTFDSELNVYKPVFDVLKEIK